MSPAPTAQVLLVLAGVGCVLLLASVVARVLEWRAESSGAVPGLANLTARIHSWWVIVGVFGGALWVGPLAIVALFGVVSAIALRELSRNTPRELADPLLDLACFAAVLVQYALLALGRADLFAVALPFLAALVLPIVAVASGGTRALQARLAMRHWWVALAVYCLSHVPGLLLLDPAGGEGRGVLLVTWLVLVTQGSDVMQYVFGKLYGRRKVAPAVSPDKTLEGLLGGVACASALGAALWWMTPYSPLQTLAVALSVTLLGFAGGLVLSAIKRDQGIKDWGDLIRGHGGVLDRVDSLCLSAPVLYHLTRALFAG